MANPVLLKSSLVVLGFVSIAAAAEPYAPPPQVAPFTLTFSSNVSNVMDVKTLTGTTTIESPEIQRLGDRNFLVGKLVARPTLAKSQVAGSRIWIPISEVLEIIEHEKAERPRPEAASGKFSPNSRVEVESGDRWWPAEILERKDDKYRIHYTGWADSWDEWVTIERMRLVAVPALDLKNVEVEWGGIWWPAEVLEPKDGKYRIHYTGYSDASDEWVTRDRIRSKAAQDDATKAD